MKPRLRVLTGGGQIPLWPNHAEIVELALPLARELIFVADAIGPESRKVAEDLVELLESPRRPRRVA